LKATKVVTFNAAAELNLGPATLVVASSAAELAPIETKFDTSTQRASLTFAEELPAGSKAILRIGFEAVLTDSMNGYYKSTWERGTYALTQFEVREWAVHMCIRWLSLLGPHVELASEPKSFNLGTHTDSIPPQ
jgi:Peptidase M1 N-terminal domain